MSKPLAWGTATALAAVLWLGGLVALCRAAPDASEQKIEAALGEPEQLEFIETPLAEVVDYLKARHKINIVVDKKALETVGVGTDTPITANIKDVSFESALWLLLRPLGLTWTIDHEVLLITTPKAYRCAPTRRRRLPWRVRPSARSRLLRRWTRPWRSSSRPLRRRRGTPRAGREAWRWCGLSKSACSW